MTGLVVSINTVWLEPSGVDEPSLTTTEVAVSKKHEEVAEEANMLVPTKTLQP